MKKRKLNSKPLISGKDKSMLEKMFKEFRDNPSQTELKLPTHLSNDQRAFLHQLSRKYGWKSKSFGKGDKRQLIISKANTTIAPIPNEDRMKFEKMLQDFMDDPIETELKIPNVSEGHIHFLQSVS